MTKNLKKLLLAATATTAAAGVFFASEATVASAAEGTNTAATAPKTRAESAAIVKALQPKVTNVKDKKAAIATKEAAVKEAEKAVQAASDKDDQIAVKKAEIETLKVKRDQLQAKEDKAKAEYDAKLAKYNTQKESLAAERTTAEASQKAAQKEVTDIEASEEYKAYTTAYAAAKNDDQKTVLDVKYADVLSKHKAAEDKREAAGNEIQAITTAEGKLQDPGAYQETAGLKDAKDAVEKAEKELANLEAYGQEDVQSVDTAKQGLETAKADYETALILLKETIKKQNVDAKTTLTGEDNQAVLTEALQLAGAQESEKPDDKKPDDKKPEGEKPEGEKPEGEKPEGEKPEGEKPEGEKPAAEENNETGFHFVVDAEQAAEDALLKNDGINKGYKIARHEYKDDKGKVTDVRYFYALTIEEGKEKGHFEDNTQGFASKANAVKAAEAALKVDHEINTGYEVNFNKRMGRYFYKLTMDGKKVVPAAKVEGKKAEDKKAEDKKAEDKKAADKKAADKKAADKKAADKKAADKKAAKKKALPKTGAIAGSVALMGLALASTGSVFAFRRRK